MGPFQQREEANMLNEYDRIDRTRSKHKKTNHIERKRLVLPHSFSNIRIAFAERKAIFSHDQFGLLDEATKQIEANKI